MSLTRSVVVRTLEIDCNVEDVVEKDLKITLESPLEVVRDTALSAAGWLVSAPERTRGDCFYATVRQFQVDRAVEEVGEVALREP